MKYGKYEIKALKIVKQMSEETMCFTCDLYVDGKKFAHVSNTGKGGCHKVMPYPPYKWPDVEKLEAEMEADKFLVQSQYEKFESAVDRLIELQEIEKQFTKLMKTKVCMIADGDVRTTGYKDKKLPVDQSLIDRVKKANPSVTILNELSIEDAVIQVAKLNDAQLEREFGQFTPASPKGM